MGVSTASNSPSVVTERDTRYLDTDGDGLLDAVEIVETVSVKDSPRGARRVVHTARTVAAEIGDDGVPHRVLGTVDSAAGDDGPATD